MNRGSATDMTIHEALNRASMRPRFMNRGSWEVPAARFRSTAGFNEAPIHESGKSVLSSTLSGPSSRLQ